MTPTDIAIFLVVFIGILVVAGAIADYTDPARRDAKRRNTRYVVPDDSPWWER